MAVATTDRCLRCATKLRAPRKVCPCCGWDPSAPPEEKSEAAGGDSGKPASHQPRRVTAKAGVKICPVCMNSVAEEQLVEQEGQRVCQSCADSLKSKAAKKAAGPPPDKK
ncbi:MAG TPA: hypothetical protein VEK08_26515 [Planctomycetota bacterium]|nr:hypothetical protein [Planctomycetota bacterium]